MLSIEDHFKSTQTILFLVSLWKQNGREIMMKKYNAEKEVLSIDEFKTKDSTKDKHPIAFEEGNSSRCVFAKNSRNIDRFHLATPRNIERLRWFAPTLIASKTHINRGKECDSIKDRYAIIGIRPDRLTLENGKYEYKKETSPKRINLLEVTAFYLVNHLQLSMNHIKKYIRHDQYIMNEIVNIEN